MDKELAIHHPGSSSVVVYHSGASLKDLGKKWFAFGRMEIGTDALLRRMRLMHRTLKRGICVRANYKTQ